jgi:hypothetical protein
MNNRMLYLLSLSFVILTFSYGWYSCGAEKKVDLTTNISKDVAVFSEEDRMAVKHMIQLHQRYGESLEYNFADPLQYRHFKKQMYRAGINEETRPQFFKMLEQNRAEHLKRYKPDQILLEVNNTASEEDTVTEGIHIISSFSSTNPTFFTTSGLLSFPYDSIITSTINIAMYQQNGNPIGNASGNSGYTPVELTDLEVATQGDNPNPSDTVVSQYSYYFVTKDQRQHYGSQLAATANVVKSIVPQAPIPCVMGQPLPSCPCTQGAGPCSGNNMACDITNMVRVCMSRFGPKCTYCNPGAATALMFPVQGYAVYDDVIRVDGSGKPQGGNYSMTAARLPVGGGCTIGVKNKFWDYVRVNKDTLFWNLPQASFTNNCLQNGDSVLFQMYIQVNIGPRSQPAYIALSNSYKTKPPSVKLAPIQIVSGCLASGTLVEMEDGKKLKIEEVPMMGKIKTTATGNPMRVEYNITGFEEPPCIRLVDDKKHSVLMTDGHPVVTPNGVVLAKKLKVGDQVLTDQGIATLVTVELEPYAGKIWNLSVGTEEDGAPITKSNTTFFANGFLVGDHKMQQYFMYNLVMSEEEAMRRLPKEWHQDYLNAKK